METSYLKAHPFGNRYPEWTPNLHSARSQDSNPCAMGSQERKRFHCTTAAPPMFSRSLLYSSSPPYNYLSVPPSVCLAPHPATAQ